MKALQFSTLSLATVMPNPLAQAQPPLEFIPPAFNPWVWNAARLILPAWLRWNSRIAEVQVENAECLVRLYEEFQAGKTRFMLAFRHPSTEDPAAMYYLLAHQIPQFARQMGISLRSPVHAHFIYDRGIPLWAGRLVGWLYSRLGCTSIRRGGLDRAGLRSARQLFVSGQFPLAAAPEGATNGHNEIVSPIEPGISQFGFWCVEDLRKAEQPQEVLIVPIGIQYHYVHAPWQSVERLMEQLERDSGIDPNSYPAVTLQDGLAPSAEQQQILYKRLYHLGEHLLTQMEAFYRKFYHQQLSSPELTLNTDTFEPGAFPIALNDQLAQRLQNLLNAALNVTEQFFAIAPKGSLTDRCRRLEQAGWDWIFREDLKQLDQLAPVERGLADRIAEETNLRIWHMRLVETFVSVTGRYVVEKPSVERFAEMVLLLWDMVTRIKGKMPFPRVKLGLQRAVLTVGEPISVSDRWPSYQENRRQAIATLTQDIQTTMEKMIQK